MAFNKVSSAFIQCRSVEVINAVEGLNLHNMKPSPVNTMIAIGYSLRGGSNVNVSFSISDGYHFDNITGLDVESLFVMGKNHTFTQIGVYHLTVFAANELTNATDEADIIVQELITNFRVGSVPTHHSSHENLTVRFSVATGTNVSYFLTIDQVNITGQWLSPNGTIAEAIIQPYFFPRAGDYSINATASNLVTPPVVLTFNVNIEIPIEGLWLNTSKKAVKTSEIITVHSKISKGSNANVLLKYNNIAFHSRSYSGNVSFSSDISFEKPGLYTIEMFVNNSISSRTLSKTVIVQIPIHKLDVTSDSPVGVFPEMVSFNISLPDGAEKPTNATLELDYGDGTPLFKMEFLSFIAANHR